MLDYRVYSLEADGHIRSAPKIIVCADDDAENQSRRLLEGNAIEVWQRIVGLQSARQMKTESRPPQLAASFSSNQKSMSASAPRVIRCATKNLVASLIGRSESSAFRLSTTTAMSMSPAGSCFSSESAPGPFHHGIRERGGTI